MTPATQPARPPPCSAPSRHPSRTTSTAPLPQLPHCSAPPAPHPASSNGPLLRAVGRCSTQRRPPLNTPATPTPPTTRTPTTTQAFPRATPPPPPTTTPTPTRLPFPVTAGRRVKLANSAAACRATPAPLCPAPTPATSSCILRCRLPWFQGYGHRLQTTTHRSHCRSFSSICQIDRVSGYLGHLPMASFDYSGLICRTHGAPLIQQKT